MHELTANKPLCGLLSGKKVMRRYCISCMVGLKPKRFTTIQRRSRHFFLLFCRQGDVLDLYICDTNGKDDVYINDKLVEEGYAKFKQGMMNNY